MTLSSNHISREARNVAIILDGNARWAEQRGLPIAEGHRAGTRAVRRTVEAAIELGVRSLALYAFSTENWSRPPDEVAALMAIFDETIDRELPDLAEQGVRTRFIGRRDRAPDALRRKMEELETTTAANDRRLVADGLAPDEVDERAVSARLYAPEMPDPDVLIRTSGERRLSNFLLWQGAYAELVFVDALWPDFGAEELRDALDEYALRRRRFGGR